MDRPPIRRTAPLISNAMWRNLAAQAFFQISILLDVLWAPGLLPMGIVCISNA
jgi:uncharacterized membrane protein YciS (DUF1049 family)